MIPAPNVDRRDSGQPRNEVDVPDFNIQTAMFLLKIKDRDGTPLNLGDIVEISDGRHIKFFARVQWLPTERALSPFHTFSFHSVRRVGDNVECLPDGVVQCTEPRFDCWYLPEPRPDADASSHEHYLTEWRKCERFLESCFDIELFGHETVAG